MLREVATESGQSARLKTKPDVDAYFKEKQAEFADGQRQLREALLANGFEETVDGKWIKSTPKKK